MWLIRQIVVPVDFSDPSEAAVDRAIDMASQLKASVTVMHAVMRAAAQDVEADEQVRRGLESLVGPRRNRGVELRTELRRGPTITAVLEITNELGADLIVVGSHGRRGMARRVLGSVAEEIVRLANVPVLVVHAYDEAERPPMPPFGLGHEAGVRQP